jgi:DNA adenine methylase
MRASPLIPPCSWPGGKSVFAPAIIEALGGGDALGPGYYGQTGRYFEPFCGMAAVALAVRHEGFGGEIVLTDIDPSVVNLWRVVKDKPEDLHECLSALVADTTEPEFYRLRDLQNADVQDPVEHAARMIYLSKRAHAGLFRRNLSGRVNMPVGHGKGEGFTVQPLSYFVDLHYTLQRSSIARASGVDVINLAGAGDLVFADPPYAGSHGYGLARWGISETTKVVRALERAASRGARCVMTEHDSPAVLALFGGRWRVKSVEVSARIQRKVAGVDRPVRREIIAVIDGWR